MKIDDKNQGTLFFGQKLEKLVGCFSQMLRKSMSQQTVHLKRYWNVIGRMKIFV